MHLPTYKSVLLGASLLALCTLSQANPSPTQLRSWAAGCASCHGTAGRPVADAYPLAGVDQATLERKLLDFKAKKIPATLMHQITAGYTDEELKALAAYFAKQTK
jgi:cytochrome subunit of sulfide dehydrogenase